MPISSVAICNMAISFLKANRIASLGDNSEEAILCNLFYEPVVDEVLRSHPWNCAIARQSLAQLAEGPVTDDFTYAYQLPQDPYCLRALDVPENPTAVYRIEGRTLLANEASVNLRYIKRVTNPVEFDSLLVKAIALRLAADVAVGISNSAELNARMMQLYELELRRAITVNALESEEPEPDENSAFSVRDAGRR